MYGPFSGTTLVSRRQKKSKKKLLLDFTVQGKITEADMLTIWLGATPSFFSIPIFYAECPSCHNPPNLSWFGTGTKCAGLHTQWLGDVLRTRNKTANMTTKTTKIIKGDATQQRINTQVM